MASATRASTTATPESGVQNPTPKLRMTERLAAKYWIERARPRVDDTDEGSDQELLDRLFQWAGEDLRDAEAKLEVALGETIAALSCDRSIDAAIALLIASALLDVRRVRHAELLAREEANG